MENNQVLDNLFDYYKNQIYKMLGLFEDKDMNGYKHCIRVRSEIEKLPYQFPRLNHIYQFKVILIKLDVLIDELFMLDGEHQFVKNHVMESLNLLDMIRGELP